MRAHKNIKFTANKKTYTARMIVEVTDDGYGNKDLGDSWYLENIKEEPDVGNVISFTDGQIIAEADKIFEKLNVVDVEIEDEDDR